MPLYWRINLRLFMGIKNKMKVLSRKLQAKLKKSKSYALRTVSSIKLSKARKISFNLYQT